MTLKHSRLHLIGRDEGEIGCRDRLSPILAPLLPQLIKRNRRNLSDEVL